jgi:hypothetical protein
VEGLEEKSAAESSVAFRRRLLELDAMAERTRQRLADLEAAEEAAAAAKKARKGKRKGRGKGKGGDGGSGKRGAMTDILVALAGDAAALAAAAAAASDASAAPAQAAAMPAAAATASAPARGGGGSGGHVRVVDAAGRAWKPVGGDRKGSEGKAGDHDDTDGDDGAAGGAGAGGGGSGAEGETEGEEEEGGSGGSDSDDVSSTGAGDGEGRDTVGTLRTIKAGRPVHIRAGDDAASIATSIISSASSIRTVHSHRSLERLIDRHLAREKERIAAAVAAGQTDDAMAPMPPPLAGSIGVAPPRVAVTTDFSLDRKRGDVTLLPHQRRNPAV